MPLSSMPRVYLWISATAVSLTCLCAHAATQPSCFDVKRFAENPLITPSMMGSADENINGPSLIRAPQWLKNKLGKYYLYFAHHEGQYIRLAYADDLHGPWKIYEPGVIHTKDLSWNPDHVASPDVLVDNEKQEIRLYFHSPVTPAPKSTDPDYRKKLESTKQDSFVGVAKDGLNFTVRPESLGPSYFRVWKYGALYYALPRLAMPLFQSKDGFAPFVKTKSPFEDDPVFKSIRHVAVLAKGDLLTVFYSKIGDAPEHILMTQIQMNEKLSDWKATSPRSVLLPQTGYEGYALQAKPSLRGSSSNPENGLRDPAVFQEDGKTYLAYSVEGERGIAMAELIESETSMCTKK